jgi:hypothetical protein
MLQLPEEILLRLTVASDRMLPDVAASLRTVLPAGGTLEEVVERNAIEPRGWCLAPVSAQGVGPLVVRQGRIVRCRRLVTGMEHYHCLHNQLVAAVFAMHAQLRDGEFGQVLLVLNEVLDNAFMLRDARVEQFAVVMGMLTRRFEWFMLRVHDYLAEFGVYDNVVMCRYMLSHWPLGPPVVRCLLQSLTTSVLSLDADVDKETIVTMVLLTRTPDVMADDFRVTLMSNCSEYRLPRTLRCIAATIAHPTVHNLAGATLCAVENHDHRTLQICIDLLPAVGPADCLLGTALVAAAENDDTGSCALLLTRAVGVAAVGSALVGSCRQNRLGSATMLAHAGALPADIDAAIQTAALWGYHSVVLMLLPHGGSLDALARALWSVASRGHVTALDAIRTALVRFWVDHRGVVQAALDRALEAAVSSLAVATVRTLLMASGPSPSAGAQSLALRTACFAGSRTMIQALLSESLTLAMNRNTINVCFVESARRQDLETVRTLKHFGSPAAVTEALSLAMAADDVQLTYELMFDARLTVMATKQAVDTAFRVGATIVLSMVLTQLSDKRFVEVCAGIAETILDSFERGVLHHADSALCRSTRCVVNLEPAGRCVLAHPQVWRSVLQLAVTQKWHGMLPHVLNVRPHHDDKTDDVLVCRMMTVAIRNGETPAVAGLCEAFRRIATVDDIELAFMTAVEWRQLPSLQLLVRYFSVSRDCLRRCRLLIQAATPGKKSDDLMCALRGPLRGRSKSGSESNENN